ncbi:MAG: DNA-binding protein WhiA [Bacilli bacterium]|nr:DNA-binding protein WhiA [Bacilli bacterium]
MSFTSNVKNEVSKLQVDKIASITLLSAIFKNAAIIGDNIKVSTENPSVARLIFNLVKELYDISSKITVRQGYNYKKNYIYILEINKKTKEIIADLSLDTNIPADYILSDDELVRIYLSGVFLTTGSINDPKKSRYHLEFFISDYDYANFIKDLLNQYSLNSKIIKRESKYMIYVKEAEKIGDFLRMINAINSLFYFEDIRIYRDHKNMTNRLNNCEQANVDKIIATCNEQIKDINLINSIGGLNLLDEKEQIAATYRLKYPETSLLELSEIISMETGNKITKSGLYHRFRKIKDLASKIKQEEK